MPRSRNSIEPLSSALMFCVFVCVCCVCVCVCVTLCKCVCDMLFFNFVLLAFASTLIYIFFSIIIAMNNVYNTTVGKYH